MANDIFQFNTEFVDYLCLVYAGFNSKTLENVRATRDVFFLTRSACRRSRYVLFDDGMQGCGTSELL
jgi:hypothetical protein